MIFFAYSEDEQNILACVYEKYGNLILRVASEYLSREDSEDALHDVMQKLSKKFEGNLQDLCDNSKSYFVTITKNHCIDIIRKRKIQANIIELVEDDSIFADAKLDPAKIMETKEDDAALKTLIQSLKPNYREILEYKYLLDYANLEIAAELGISPSVVSSRLMRARNQLKEIIERRDSHEIHR